MNIIEELISSLDLTAKINDIRQGLFHTAVLTRHCGLAANVPRDALRQQPPLVREAGSLLNKSVLQLVQLARSQSMLEAAIGMATINSLLDIDLDKCHDLNAGDLLATQGKGKNIAVVGHFPFVSRLYQTAKELWVIEKNPCQGDFSEADAQNLIPRADVVGISGTALTNHTLDDLLRLVRQQAFVVLIGDTAPLSPVLFDYGVDAVCGTRVIDAQRALACISQGANFRQIKGVQRLTIFKRLD